MRESQSWGRGRPFLGWRPLLGGGDRVLGYFCPSSEADVPCGEALKHAAEHAMNVTYLTQRVFINGADVCLGTS